MSFVRCERCKSDCTDSCFGEKARSFQFPTVSQMRGRFRERETVVARDNRAYKNLRKEGLQPSHVEGSAEIEAKLSKTPEPDPSADGQRVVDLQAVRAGVQ